MSNPTRLATTSIATTKLPTTPIGVNPTDTTATGELVSTENRERDPSDDSGSPASTGSQTTTTEPSTKGLTEPLTISLDRELIRRVRVIAACRGTTVSRIVTALLTEAVQREMPIVLAELQGSVSNPKDGER